MATLPRSFRCAVTLRPLLSRRIITLSTSLRQSISRQCRHAAGYSTQANSQKPFYVTTPIFYVNAAPHVGHLYSMVLGDVIKRWEQLKGNKDAIFLTGTDEHGIKIQQAAQEAGMDTQAFCDMNCKTFKDLARAANISNDHFIRTTDEAHKDAVRYFWEMLQHRGYIYTKKHEGWYSVSDEAFYPQSQVEPSLDPATGRKRMVSTETGKEVEWSSETNYHFRLSAFRDRLLEFYELNPKFILSKSHMMNVKQAVEEGLQDLSVSRPVERLTWGVRVPGDDSQTIYVWLDALINYLTKAGYPFTPGKESDLGWPADLHIVGKDIIRFHCIYWPAFLMALDLPLPRHVLVHGHWTMNKAKMSKSTGNVVNPFFAIDRFSVDIMRFFLTLRGPLGDDSNYDNSNIVNDYKKYLQYGVGNVYQRLMGLTKMQLRPSIEAARSGFTTEPNEYDIEFEQYLHTFPKIVERNMEAFHSKAALREIVDATMKAQNYFHHSAPWQHKDDLSRCYRVFYNVSEYLRIAGILLQPFVPQKASEVLDRIGVRQDAVARGFGAAQYGADYEYGHAPKVDKRELLFPPLMVED
ncbi:methionyl-tRNA synthetase, putative [Talaromyces stipitatus ATCC 10500]|uniref:Probable methionine--tRNA ligase, mitochondrial n=1 Tax=Talaromyces stipitatus (strain ATCC 10500 / CBS 375.48 / QM 6759 / NRRL 1006) TaxID=441959 RepID=B8MK72_TALSN|nr:methionyl-tRNA synthetase, putative [Talaromyces stipitatus ATCC 10500]EED15227.1 methionyl-tRNA synthetase, putative [Talaromyces stipitatus ATCC 10500]